MKVWHWLRGHGWIVIGVVGTAAYLAGLRWLVGPPSVIAVSARELGLNELGDFLAGVFAPLAFLWLIVGILQQQREISHNTRALALQEEALRQQVRETGSLVEQTARQAKAAEEQVSATSEAAQSERDREKKAARPAFVLNPRGGSKSGGRYTKFALRLENVGASAREVNIDSESDGPPVRYLDAMDRGAKVDWGVSIKPDQPEFNVHVTYRDVLDTSYRKRFRVCTVDATVIDLPEEEL